MHLGGDPMAYCRLGSPLEQFLAARILERAEARRQAEIQRMVEGIGIACANALAKAFK